MAAALIVFAVAAVSTGAVLAYLSATEWFTDPTIGIVVFTALAIGVAFGVTAISTGLRNRRAVYGSLIVALLGVALYFPMMNYILNGMTLWFFLLLAVLSVVVSGAIGWFWAARTGPRWRAPPPSSEESSPLSSPSTSSCRTGKVYTNSSRVGGTGRSRRSGVDTPDLGGNFWVQGIDTLHPPAAADDRDHPDLVRRATPGTRGRACWTCCARTTCARPAPRASPENKVIINHALKNALIPVITLLGLQVATLLSGSVITETVFGWTGMGRLFIDGLARARSEPRDGRSSS